MSGKPLQTNAADPTQRAYAQQVEEARERRFTRALSVVLQTPDGRHAFAEILHRTGLYQGGYVQNGSQMYFNEGRREWGWQLRTLLEEANEHLVGVMDREYRELARAQDRATETSRRTGDPE